MADKYDAALDKADKQDKEDTDMRQDKIANTTTVSYEDRAGARYSYTYVFIVGADEESNPDELNFDARHLSRNSSAASK